MRIHFQQVLIHHLSEHLTCHNKTYLEIFEAVCRLEQVSKEGRVVPFKRPFNQEAGFFQRFGSFLAKWQVVANKRSSVACSFCNMLGHGRKEYRRVLELCLLYGSANHRVDDCLRVQLR